MRVRDEIVHALGRLRNRLRLKERHKSFMSEEDAIAKAPRRSYRLKAAFIDAGAFFGIKTEKHSEEKLS